MIKTVDFLDKIRERHHLTSDYQLIKFTGWSKSAISGYRNKPQYFSDENAIQAAQFLDLPEGFVLACVHAERAKNPATKTAWQHAAHALCPPEMGKECILCKIPHRRPLGQFDLFNHTLSNVLPFSIPGHNVQMPLLYAV